MPSAVYTCYLHVFRKYQFIRYAMELVYFVNLIFVFVLNILFFFSGICLNSLVIVSFWRSVQLRKKLCHFTIMILSCCDLLVVLTAHPSTALGVMLQLTEEIKANPEWLDIFYRSSNTFVYSSLLALLVISVDQYLATHYPLFHRTFVTKRKLLTLFAVLCFIQITVMAISVSNLVVSYQVGFLIFGILFIPPMLFINYKLFTVARKNRRNKGIPPEIKKSFSLKNVSGCLLVVACLLVSSIPNVVYIVLRLTSKESEGTLDNAALAGLWSATTAAMNSTCNSLIFYWKNKTLRTEGMKVIKSMKMCRRGQSRPAQPEQSNNNGT